MPGNAVSDKPEKRFVWDDACDSLLLLGRPKQDDEQATGNRKQLQTAHKSKIYCPHAYLDITFYETLDPGEKIRFRKMYMRKVPPNEPNVIILQDVKDLVMFLAVNPISLQFINFFHIPVVDRFLRALIVYFQYYIEIWEDLCQKRAATQKKAPNPLAGGGRIRQAGEMETLRNLLAREYVHVVVGAGDSKPYHHMTVCKKTRVDSTTQSQGEKDLRIFEVLLRLSHRVVWIALQRKYFNLIEVEMHRLFRTDAYNTADRRGGGSVNADMLEEEIRVLQGAKMPFTRKLLRNSALPYQTINQDCDFRVMALGILNLPTNDPRIRYLVNALLAEEESLPKMGIKVGILGQPRTDYDAMLMLCEEEERPEEEDDDEAEKEKWERRRSSIESDTSEPQRKVRLQEDQEIVKMPAYGPDPELIEVFPAEEIDMRCRGHHKARESSRKKWAARAVKQRSDRFFESISTIVD